MFFITNLPLIFIIYFPRNWNWIDWEKPRTFSSFAFLIYAGNIDNYTQGNLQVTRFANYWQILCSLGSYICNSNSNCISFNFLQFPLFLFSWKLWIRPGESAQLEYFIQIQIQFKMLKRVRYISFNKNPITFALVLSLKMQTWANLGPNVRDISVCRQS